MLRERKNLLWLVVLFLAACAVVGFLTGIRGSLPAGRSLPMAGAPIADPRGEVIDAAPLDEAILAPPAEPEPKAEPEPEPEPEEEEEAPPPAPEPKPAPKPAPKPKPQPAPKPRPEPAEDPLGDLLEALPPDAVIY